MNSHEPPSGWQELRNAAGNWAATARGMSESFGHGPEMRVPGSEIGAAQPPNTTGPPPPTDTVGLAGAWNVAHVDHGPTVSPRCARARHEYITSKSRSKGIRCAPKFG